MQETLLYLKSVEGVIGAAIFSQQGKVLNSSFPAFIDAASLKLAAHQVVELLQGVQIDQTFEMIDFRYVEGRILIKKIAGGMVYLLCSKNVNIHLVATNLNLAAHKIESCIAESQAQAPLSEPSNLDKILQQPDIKSDPSVLTLQISHLTSKEASASFDSLGMVALSQPTSQYIFDFYKRRFKKISLTVTATGKSGIFPVMVMKDMETVYDGTVIVGPSIEKKLSIASGENVEVRIV